MDLGAVLGIATRQLDALLESSGCTVAVYRLDRDALGDAFGAPVESLVGTHPALVLPLGQEQFPTEVAGTTPTEGATARVILKASVVDLATGDAVRVETSRDARQLGAAFTVLRVLDASVGVARVADVVQRPA